MDEHNLSAVKFDQPNGLFRLVNRYNDAGYVLSDIYTDGKVTTVKIKWQQGNTEAGYYESIEMVSVSDATWTIVQKEKKSKWEVDYRCFLYTTKSIKDLDLPNIPTSPNRE